MVSKPDKEEAKMPKFTEHPMDAYVVKNRPAILNCSVIYSDKAYFTCNSEAQSKSNDHVEKNLVDNEGRVVRILSLVIYREQVNGIEIQTLQCWLIKILLSQILI